MMLGLVEFFECGIFSCSTSSASRLLGLVEFFECGILRLSLNIK